MGNRHAEDCGYDLVVPAAAPMIESMRAHGYSAATAVADLIDNSISADARHIWLNFHWAGANSYVYVLDDGCGMDEDTLRNAMRPGSKSPLDQRDPNDLGRFGLGLKTASFSQCRRLTVASKKRGGSVIVRRWDLDHVLKVNEWQLLKAPSHEAEKYLTPLGEMKEGTMVLWEIPDRLIEKEASSNNRAAQERFLRMIQDVQSYLSMVFHRYLEGVTPSLTIFINETDDDHRVRPWDPFLRNHTATSRSPEERIFHPNGEIRLQAFVLPHKDMMSAQEIELAAGPSGWNAHQGFFVYRNRRMLVGGGWLGLGSVKPWMQEEHYRLARILVDMPNTQDHDWQIDVKKSTAKPPAWLRDRLRVLAENTRKHARHIFAHRGSYGPRGPQIEVTRAWLPRTVSGRRVYRIDRHHPLVKAASEIALTAEHKKLFEAMLRTLEETVPVAQIWLDTAEYPEGHSRPFETADDLEKRRMLETAYRVFREIHGLKPEAARHKLLRTDGFQDMGRLIDTLVD